MALFALDDLLPRLPAGFCFVAESASIIGNVELGEDVGIWFGAVLRGDNELIQVGRGSNIQDLCMLHTDAGFPLTVGDGCTVGHRAILHGCTIGAHSLIGMGAIVLNGARIGRHCLIGASALVTQGMDIPDNSLVLGAPARVVRTLTPGEIEGLGQAALHYVMNARRFTERLRPI